MSAHGTANIDYLSRVSLCLADVVAQISTPGITEREVLQAGYGDLMPKAEMIDNLDWRRSFLEDEIANRALVAHWRSRDLAASDRDQARNR